ncbi:thioredoxin-dependent thiol peroxidase [Candidatus Woesearchaeota archaeon]|nr:thioredoxin-dependent thiol peroxidase [Candidatus Woesearchaeota archaeon]
MLKEGNKAPEFCLQNQDEEKKCLKDYKKWKVIYFYPKDATPGCTTEALDFTALVKDFLNEKCVVLGISKDTCKSHRNFIAKESLDIELLSDPEHQVQENYGVWQLKRFMGREYMGTARTTFLVDPKGIIRKIWEDVNVNGHASEVLETLRKLN